ncbi:MAG: hypothetical protein ABSC25_02115 [Roseiarcus sp.]
MQIFDANVPLVEAAMIAECESNDETALAAVIASQMADYKATRSTRNVGEFDCALRKRYPEYRISKPTRVKRASVPPLPQARITLLKADFKAGGRRPKVIDEGARGQTEDRNGKKLFILERPVKLTTGEIYAYILLLFERRSRPAHDFPRPLNASLAWTPDIVQKRLEGAFAVHWQEAAPDVEATACTEKRDREQAEHAKHIMEERARLEKSGETAQVGRPRSVEAEPDGVHAHHIGVRPTADRGSYDNSDDEVVAEYETGRRIEVRGTERAEQARRRQLKKWVSDAERRVRDDPALFARVCKVEDRTRARDMLSIDDVRTDEALGWIVLEKPLVDGEPVTPQEQARRDIVEWMKSGMSQREFCRSKGVGQTSFRNTVAKFCAGVAERLNASGVTVRAEPVLYKNPDLLFGLDAIANALGKTTKKTQSLIDTGSIPVGEIGGRWCASVKMLRPYSARKARVANDNVERAAIAAAA